MVKMKFIQPFGLDWPLPSSGIVIPSFLLEILAKLYHIDPEVLIKAYEGPLPPQGPDRLLPERVPIPRPPPGPLTPEVLEETRHLDRRLDAVHRALNGLANELEEIRSHLTGLAPAAVREKNLVADDAPTMAPADEEEGAKTETPGAESGGETPGPENEEGGS